MIWLGWWMRRTTVKKGRLFSVLLLPTRVTCAAFCALGALIGSIGQLKGELTWNEFLLIPEGKKIYQYSGSGLSERQVEVGKKFERRGYFFRNISIGVGKKRIETLVHRENFHNHILLVEKLTKKKYGRLNAAAKFIRGLQSSRIIYPMLEFEREYQVITNKTEWKRQISDVLIESSNELKPRYLENILNPCEHEEEKCQGFLLSFRGKNINITNIPLTILDGPESLKVLENISSKNVIILLDQIEYDQNSHDILSMLASAREDNLIPPIEGIPKSLPVGIDMSIFAVKS